MNNKQYRISIFVCISIVLISIPIKLFLFSHGGKIIQTSIQPDSVKYDAKYELQIKEGVQLASLFSDTRYIDVIVSRQGNDFSYGHSLEFNILGIDIYKTKVEWTSSGINLEFNTGHMLFIPKKSFEGGR